MAIGVQEYAVFCLVAAAIDSPDDVMAMPPRQFGDFLVTERAESLLLFPKVVEFPFPLQVLLRFHIEAMLKVGFPGRVIRIGVLSDFHLPLNGCACCCAQLYLMGFPVFLGHGSKEHPLPVSNGTEVFLSYPFFPFMGVPSLCPLPHKLVDGAVNFRVDRFAHDMLVVQRPSPNTRIERHDQPSRRDLLAIFHDLSDFFQEALYLLLGGFDDEFHLLALFVLAYILSEKVKSLGDMRDLRLFLG